MDDINDILARVATAPVPARLATIDAAVLERLHSGEVRPVLTTRAGIAAVAFALMVGIAGGMAPSTESAARASGLLGGAQALAPSALLTDER